MIDGFEITPELVLSAYAATGFSATRRRWRNGGLTCPLVAIRGCLLGLGNGTVDLDTLVPMGPYVVGFADGFDDTHNGRPTNYADYVRGHAAGQRAWAAVVEAGLVT